MNNSTVLLNHKASDNGRVKLSSYIFVIFIVLLPISTALSGLIGNISFLNYVALAYIAISAFEIVYKRYIWIRKQHWAIYAYMGYALLSCLWNSVFSFNFYFTTFAISFALLLISTCRTYSTKEADLLRNAFLLSSIVVIGVTLLNINHTYAGRIVIHITSTMDPNDFGCGTCIVFSALLVQFSKNRKFLPMIALIGILLSVILTGSRGAILMCITELIIWVALYKKRGRWKTVILCILVLLAIYLFALSMPDELLTRFSISQVLTSGGTGRDKIWLAAIKKYIDSDLFHQIFGYGHGSFPKTVNYYGGTRTYPYEAHNMFVNSIIEGGLIGSLFLIISIIQCTKTAYANKNYMGVIAILGFTVTGLTLDVQSYRIFPMAFFTAVFFENEIYYPNRITEMQHESL